MSIEQQLAADPLLLLIFWRLYRRAAMLRVAVLESGGGRPDTGGPSIGIMQLIPGTFTWPK